MPHRTAKTGTARDAVADVRGCGGSVKAVIQERVRAVETGKRGVIVQLVISS